MNDSAPQEEQNLKLAEVQVAIAGRMGLDLTLEQARIDVEAERKLETSRAQELITAEPGLSQKEAAKRARQDILTGRLAYIAVQLGQTGEKKEATE